MGLYLGNAPLTLTPKAVIFRNQARSQGGGVGRPLPQLPIPKILFHPLAILFHPLAILFHPWNMWMTSHGQCPMGGACECPRGGCFPIFFGVWRHADNVQGGVPVNVQEWGRFSNWWRHADNVQEGGCAWCSTHPSSVPPTWLAGYGPAKLRTIPLSKRSPLYLLLGDIMAGQEKGYEPQGLACDLLTPLGYTTHTWSTSQSTRPTP